MRSYQNFMGGEWTPAASGQTFTNLNPADTREAVAQYPQGGRPDAQAAIAADANFSQAWLYLARVQRDLFQMQEAEKSFRKAIEIDPDYLEARSSFGGMLLDVGSTDESIRQLNAVVQRDKKNKQAHSLLAQALRMKELYADSIDSAKKAIALPPDTAESHFWLAESLRMTAKYADSVVEYQKYLQLSDFDSKLAGKMNYYVLGYLAGILFEQQAGVAFNHVSYRSSAQAVIDAVAGRVEIQFSTLAPAIPLGEALCSPKRDHRVSPLRGGPVMTVECISIVSNNSLPSISTCARDRKSTRLNSSHRT